MQKGELQMLRGQAPPPNSRDPTDRRAMTLFEILLVLVLLVIVSSMAVPLFDGGFATMRLRRGSDQVVAAWIEARVQAIQSGRTHQFRFQPDTGNYRVEQWQVLQESAEGVDRLLGMPDLNQKVQTGWVPYQAKLPEEIKFAEGDALIRDAAGESAVTSLNQAGNEAWSDPILFFPDGSTSAASVVLKNERSLFQRITSRALTGVARASDVLTKDELERLKSI
jgi:Tfp pilus assembly protein FimT